MIKVLLAGIFVWALTALGASFIFFVRRVNKKTFSFLLGTAAGIMLSASFWSLLLPAVEIAKENSRIFWLPPILGFILGVAFLKLLDRVLPHLHLGFNVAEGPKTSWKRSVLLILALTIHNIPEGLAVGAAMAGALLEASSLFLSSALFLTLGIGLQDIPEGFAVSLALRKEGVSVAKSFFYGQVSGIVEPIFALVGAVFIFWIKLILPYALGFAAGAMIFVVVEEVIPESQRSEDTDLATLGTMVGFLLMMILDIAFR